VVLPVSQLKTVGIPENPQSIRHWCARTPGVCDASRCNLIPSDLNAIVQNLGSLLDKVISSDIEIKVNPGVRDPIQADPVQIERVLIC
jgi:hypothetical protein